jgi:DNA-binding NarL/FixJ family response regulator
LKDDGWDTLCEVSPNEGVLRATRETVHAVVLALDDEGAEGALIAGELKRQRPKLPIIMIVPEGSSWLPEATAQAEEVVIDSNERADLPAALRRLLGSGQALAAPPAGSRG